MTKSVLGDLGIFGKELSHHRNSRASGSIRKRQQLWYFPHWPFKNRLTHQFLAAPHCSSAYRTETEKGLEVWTVIIKSELDGIFVILNV